MSRNADDHRVRANGSRLRRQRVGRLPTSRAQAKALGCLADESLRVATQVAFE
jgi:hypothetical protein